MNPKVYVAAITDPKNGNTSLKRLELRCEIQRPVTTQAGKIGFLMGGATGPKGVINENIEKRVTWENISAVKLAAWGIKVNDNLEDKLKMPCKIVVEERHTPFFEGQNPKINPTTSEILTKNGQQIFRNSRLTFNMAEQDVYIQHDALVVPATVSTEFSNANAEVSTERITS